ncbi:MAG: tetratricopeptide repeat protein [Bacteroidetes bacterium]|nr:MAG: tetratricopeptide repeat protein [Bacteroidota bacterium]
MKTNMTKISAIAGVCLFSTVALAQKKNETSAAVEFKNKYQMSMATGDIENAKKALIAAKGFIDLAAEHPETKESPKTLYYKGEIYSNFLFVGMQAADTNFLKLAGEDALEVAIAAYKKGFDVSDKYDKDIKDAVYQKRAMLDPYANMLYKNEMFKEAGELYSTQAEFLTAVSEIDTTSLFNGALCYEKGNEFIKAGENYAKTAAVGYRGATSYVLASSAYRKGGDSEKAKAIVAEGRKKYPSDKDLLLELVNINIDAGDAAGAEAALNEAISKDPNNKQLHYTIGTIYIDLKQNDKAEQALNKALEIDGDYIDALYQLGAHLVTWAGDTKTAANQLKFGDPKYNVMLAEADDLYKRALVPLEKYITKIPEDKDVLNILFQIHRSLGNSEKALEYKKRADAIK